MKLLKEVWEEGRDQSRLADCNQSGRIRNINVIMAARKYLRRDWLNNTHGSLSSMLTVAEWMTAADETPLLLVTSMSCDAKSYPATVNESELALSCSQISTANGCVRLPQARRPHWGFRCTSLQYHGK